MDNTLFPAMRTDAPFPTGINYEGKRERDNFTNYGKSEDSFAGKRNLDKGRNIPDNYLDIFMNNLKEICEYCMRHEGFPHEWDNDAWSCTVTCIYFKFNDIERSLVLTYDEIRPCAINESFYEIILWTLKSIVVAKELNLLRIEDCLETASKICERLGFSKVKTTSRRNPKGYDYIMTKSELENISLQDWGLDGKLTLTRHDLPMNFTLNEAAFPSASQLNSQKYVDDKFRQMSLGVAIPAMAARDLPPSDDDSPLLSSESRQKRKSDTPILSGPAALGSESRKARRTRASPPVARRSRIVPAERSPPPGDVSDGSEYEPIDEALDTDFGVDEGMAHPLMDMRAKLLVANPFGHRIPQSSSHLRLRPTPASSSASSRSSSDADSRAHSMSITDVLGIDRATTDRLGLFSPSRAKPGRALAILPAPRTPVVSPAFQKLDLHDSDAPLIGKWVLDTSGKEHLVGRVVEREGTDYRIQYENGSFGYMNGAMVKNKAKLFQETEY